MSRGASRCHAACIATIGAVFWSCSAAARDACLSGFVRDAAGRPVRGGDLDIYDSATGIKLSTSSDNTDAAGFYSVCVPVGFYRVTFAPPPGTHLLGREFPQVDLRHDRGLELDVVLDAGRVVTGIVRGADGAPLGGVDIDVDRMAGGRMFTPNDKGDAASGAYAVVVPDGSYRFRFTPPRGARWQGAQVESVAVAGDRALDVNLEPGALLYGQLRDTTGQPLADVEIDLRRPPGGARVFIVHGSTGADGDYAATVPGGTFEVRLVPPRRSRAVAARIDRLTIAGDTRLDGVLPVGMLVTTVAIDSADTPLEDADLNVVQEASGLELFLPDDETDGAGRAQLVLPPDVYAFGFEPPPGSGLDEVVLRGVSVRRDTTIAAWLPSRLWVHVTGRVLDTAGRAVAAATVGVHAPGGGSVAGVPRRGTDPSGGFDLALPRGAFELWVAPPRGARLVARDRLPCAVAGDAVLADIVLEPGVLLTARIADALDVPVRGAVLRLAGGPAGGEVWLPDAETDADGVAAAALAPGRYDAIVVPPAGAALRAATLAGIEVDADTTVAIALPDRGGAGPQLAVFLSLAPNPFGRAIELGVRLRAPARVTIDLYDTAGRRVQRLEQSDRPASAFTCSWDGRRADGEPAPSGTYFVVLRAPGTTDTRKILLVR